MRGVGRGLGLEIARMSCVDVGRVVGVVRGGVLLIGGVRGKAWVLREATVLAGWVRRIACCVGGKGLRDWLTGLATSCTRVCLGAVGHVTPYAAVSWLGPRGVGRLGDCRIRRLRGRSRYSVRTVGLSVALTVRSIL